jgi:hypothetical protein
LGTKKEAWTVRRISSRWTWWYKRGSPTVFFGFLALFALLVGVPALNQQAEPLMILGPAGIALFGYLLMRWLVFPLADGVYLSDDLVIVRNGGEEDSFPITNIINVESSRMTHPERITLTLREPCRFGREVLFSPLVRWGLGLTRHPLADELIRRANGLPPE